MYNDKSFSQILSELRRSSGLSQRKAAADLKISQALLSHYENGAREPGLNFVCRVCDYYNVTADYLLGRSAKPRVFRFCQFLFFGAEYLLLKFQ